MAQVWLTYDEMAESFGGTPDAARAGAIENGWSRIKGRDGVTHVRLPPTLADQYMRAAAGHMEAGRETDALVDSLRGLSRAGQGAPLAQGVSRAA